MEQLSCKILNFFGEFSGCRYLKLKVMVVNLDTSKYIRVIYGCNEVLGQFGFRKTYWKVVFSNGLMHFFRVKFLVLSL